VLQTVAGLRPDLLLVDTFPGGTFGELAACLELAPRRALIARAVRPELAEIDAYAGLVPLYDRKIIPGDALLGLDPSGGGAEGADGAASAAVPPILSRQREELPTRAAARASLGVAEGQRAAEVRFARFFNNTPLAISAMYNRPPFTIAVKADGPIKTPKDMEGRTLGGPANDGALKLFPAFAKLAGVDAAKVQLTNMQPNLREQMLQRGQVDGVFGFVNTIRFSAKLVGIDPDKDFRFINYGDFGMDLYSNAIIASRKLVNENPTALRGLLAAINKGLKDTLKDPDAAIEAVAKREPLINKAVEKERLIATLNDEMSHPELATIGIGDINDARFAKSIGVVVEADGLPRTPAPEEIFSRAFLPPVADRVTKLL
jgi:NitT/TauT family transport system substrate-binding protein